MSVSVSPSESRSTDVARAAEIIFGSSATSSRQSSSQSFQPRICQDESSRQSSSQSFQPRVHQDESSRQSSSQSFQPRVCQDESSRQSSSQSFQPRVCQDESSRQSSSQSFQPRVYQDERYNFAQPVMGNVPATPQYMCHPNAGYYSRPVPIIMTDDIVSGTQRNNRMSPVRRFFCLLVTFDVTFVALLWVLSILVTEKDLFHELRRQIIEYSIYDSMFDCICVATLRFLLCICGYAFLYISHWCVVATTTAGTIAFIATKVFMYRWTVHNPITYDVMLVLTSFIIAWAEAWMLDFRVLPLEGKAKEIWGRHFDPTERTPLLHDVETSDRMSGYLCRTADGSTLYEGSVGNFYSPVESPNQSDDEFEDLPSDCGVRIPKKFRRKKNLPFSTQESEFKKLGQEVVEEAWRNLNSNGWKMEKQVENGDSVHVKTVNGKKVFKLTGLIDIAAPLLLEELFFRIEQMPQWNPTVAECRIIQSIDQHTDVTYQVCAEAAGGILSTRDFVSLRHWDQVDGAYVSAGVSVTHPSMPPHHKRIRGENGPNCFAMRPVGPGSDHCLFQWLLDTDLKGWVPRNIVDKALSAAQLEYISHVRRRVFIMKQTWNI